MSKCIYCKTPVKENNVCSVCEQEAIQLSLDLKDKQSPHRIPVTWEVYGIIEIDNPNITLDEAIEMVKRDSNEEGQPFALPTDSDYVDGSFRVSEDQIEHIMLYQK